MGQDSRQCRLLVQSRNGAVLTLFEEDSDSAVDENTLLHREALFVVSASDSQNVAFELGSKDLSIDVGAHSPVMEVATTDNGQ